MTSTGTTSATIHNLVIARNLLNQHAVYQQYVSNVIQYSPLHEAMMALHIYLEMLWDLQEEYQQDGGVYANEWTL